MNARRLGGAIGAVTLVGSGTYVFVYLYRWEWNRALISGVFFLAAEVALATLMLSGRMQRMAAETADLRQQLHRQRVVHHLQASAPAPRDHFAWVRRPGQLNVFVPVLLGAGVLLSGLAWCVERLGRLTAGPALERGLADRLGTLAPPVAGFVPTDDGTDLLLRRPQRPDALPAPSLAPAAAPTRALVPVRATVARRGAGR
jgi:hypothetical protein